jgi:hypothetical protein
MGFERPVPVEEKADTLDTKEAAARSFFSDLLGFLFMIATQRVQRKDVHGLT